MLQLEHIRKSYTTNDFTQVALDDVSLAFRDNEFVSILGQSGSGKTTMLNVIGGLDHFDSGDLLVDGVSTREYRDRDWDAYRNNRIGFVFQSYNLIPHQTILANVELALTLSGVSPAERRERARKALGEVGLGDHVDKRPSQLSGGQMQRVAIARALINDPEILLADEPTGALDSKTSVQVMDLLREVATDRLVIMVTHNPELAHEYSTRIVELADGNILSDSDPFVPTKEDMRDAKPAVRTSMSFLTALSLSFNNLMTKKGRTLMTPFAGSIGIIGIAAILSLANGVNAYIQEVEEETLSVYPLQIMSAGFDMTSLLVDLQGSGDEEEPAREEDDRAQDDRVHEMRMVGSMFGSVGKNDLASLKEYLDGDGGGVRSHVQHIEYVYNVVPQIFDANTSDGVRQVNPDKTFSAFGIGASSSALVSSSAAFSTNVFAELPSDLSLIEGQFDVKAGRWPKERDELVLVLSRTGRITDIVSYALGLRDHDELSEMVQRLANDEEFEAPTDERDYTFDELMAPEFRVVPAASTYVHEEDFGVWTSKIEDDDFMRPLVESAQALRIVGVVQQREDVDASSISQGVYYTRDLTRWLMDEAANAPIVKAQIADPTVNVISGKSFDAEAKERGESFDMSSLFTVDEDKLAGAFSIDPNGLDLSGLDMSRFASALDFGKIIAAIDLRAMSVPQLDLSSLTAIDLSGITLEIPSTGLAGFDVPSLLSPEVVEAIAPSIAGLNPLAVFEGVSPQVDEERFAALANELEQGYVTYLQEHPGTLPAAYFALPEIRARIQDEARAMVTVTEDDRQKIESNLADQLLRISLSDEQLSRLDDLTQVVVKSLSQQVSGQVATSLAWQLSNQLAEGLAASIATGLESFMGQLLGGFMGQVSSALQSQLTEAFSSVMQGGMAQLMSNMAGAFHIDEKAFAEAFSFNMSQQELAELMSAMMSTERTSYESNLVKLGYADEAKPSEIDIYPINFDSKAEVIEILDAYNERMRDTGEDDKVITYTDLVGALMSSVTDIVNMISYVLIAFVAISLVVSSIMIGVITYISVLERKKEIGILRSIGASKRDVSNVFNAETVIEGLVSGLMGVGITALMCIPANIIVEQNFGVVRVARLPLGAAVILVGVSVLLSFVAGLMPSRKAAKADPVEALRSE